MRVLLLNPAVDFDRQFGTLSDFYTPVPSIGLAYIGAVLRQAGYEVDGLDSFMACHTGEEMYESSHCRCHSITSSSAFSFPVRAPTSGTCSRSGPS